MSNDLFVHDEMKRLADLNAYQILDTPEEVDFDDLVELAALICNCPTSLISFVDEDRQWFKARRNLDALETSRDISFCSHAIQQDDVFTVDNPLEDDRFKNNSLVTGSLQIRFYAGAPIVSAAGSKLGTICVIDNIARMLTSEQKEALKKLSRQASRLLELRLQRRLLEKVLLDRQLI
ncbi:MAG: GAF domain-containing protein [Chitinophagaceae bacterium]